MSARYSFIKPAKRFEAYLIFLLAASFYLYEFVLQVAPGVMASSMMQSFNVSAAGFGVISAFYFYAYAPMQLPAGILFDRYGPRKLMTAALILCALGSFFFASTESIFTASLGRFLIGVGSAFSFIGVLVLVSRWFPPHQFALLAGIAQLMSSVGAMFGEVPLASLIQQVGWRQASFILAAIGLFLALFLWLIVRDHPQPQIEKKVKNKFSTEWHRLIAVCKNQQTWVVGVYACTIWTPIAVFAALWGVPYLQQKFQISVIVASSLCSMIWLGIGIGSPLLGWYSDHCKTRRSALIISAVLGLIATLILLYKPNVSITSMYAILFLLGLGAGGQTVSFAVVKENNIVDHVGTASGFNNLAVLIGGAVFQPIVGLLLNQGEWYLNQGIPVYTIANYNKALLVMPCCYAISLITAAFFLKERPPNL